MHIVRYDLVSTVMITTVHDDILLVDIEIDYLYFVIEFSRLIPIIFHTERW